MQTCPVCGKPADESVVSEYKGKVYSFACRGCKGRFDEEPERYLGAPPQPRDHHPHGHHHPD